MSKVSLLGAVVVLAAFLGIALCCWNRGAFSQIASAAPNNGIVLDPVALDLGDQSVGQSVPFALYIKNASSGPVKVLAVVSRCSCAAVNVKTPILVQRNDVLKLDFAITIEEELTAERRVDVLVDDAGQLRQLNTIVRYRRQGS